MISISFFFQYLWDVEPINITKIAEEIIMEQNVSFDILVNHSQHNISLLAQEQSSQVTRWNIAVWSINLYFTPVIIGKPVCYQE